MNFGCLQKTLTEKLGKHFNIFQIDGCFLTKFYRICAKNKWGRLVPKNKSLSMFSCTNSVKSYIYIWFFFPTLSGRLYIGADFVFAFGFCFNQSSSGLFGSFSSTSLCLVLCNCCDMDFLNLASLQSSQPCDDIPSWEAAFIITGNRSQGRDMRDEVDCFDVKHWIQWDLERVNKGVRRVWDGQVGTRLKDTTWWNFIKF